MKLKFIPIPGKTFEMLDAPVTQRTWRRVMKTDPFYFKNKPDNPAETISWNNCQEFIKKLNDKSKKYTYRLPTEEEWEYCCRAGSTTEYCFGDDENKLDKYAWYYKNSDLSTQPVKQKLPNKFGLYDMHGNVWEWTDNLHNKDSSYHVIRGGGWYNYVLHLRSASRYNFRPDFCSHVVGFRLLRTKRNSQHSYHLTLDKERLAVSLSLLQEAIEILKKLIK